MHRIQGNCVHHHGDRVRSPLDRSPSNSRAKWQNKQIALNRCQCRAFCRVFVSTSSLGSIKTLYMRQLNESNVFGAISAEAEMIMQNEPNLLEWPRGLPSVSSIDQARIDVDIAKRLHPPSLWAANWCSAHVSPPHLPSFRFKFFEFWQNKNQIKWIENKARTLIRLSPHIPEQLLTATMGRVHGISGASQFAYYTFGCARRTLFKMTHAQMCRSPGWYRAKYNNRPQYKQNTWQWLLLFT